jgi:hypothetical protein
MDIDNPFGDDEQEQTDDFKQECIETHCRIKRYGPFELVEAISPGYDLKIVPEAGYKVAEAAILGKEQNQIRVPLVVKGKPCLIISVSKEDLLKILVELIFHFFRKNARARIRDMQEKRFFKPIRYSSLSREVVALTSCIYDFEEVLFAGCFAISFYDYGETREVGLDEHKLIYLTGVNFADALQILAQYELVHKPKMHFLFEGEHFHSLEKVDGFDNFVTQICVDTDEQND